MLAGLLLEEEEAALVLPPPRRLAGLAVGHPARDLLLEEEAAGECMSYYRGGGKEASPAKRICLLDVGCWPERAPPCTAGKSPSLCVPRHGCPALPAGEHGSPSFADRHVYCPEPTPYRCETCGVYCTSQRLLEAHKRGRKHQRRLAGIDSPSLRPSSPQ